MEHFPVALFQNFLEYLQVGRCLYCDTHTKLRSVHTRCRSACGWRSSPASSWKSESLCSSLFCLSGLKKKKKLLGVQRGVKQEALRRDGCRKSGGAEQLQTPWCRTSERSPKHCLLGPKNVKRTPRRKEARASQMHLAGTGETVQRKSPTCLSSAVSGHKLASQRPFTSRSVQNQSASNCTSGTRSRR